MVAANLPEQPLEPVRAPASRPVPPNSTFAMTDSAPFVLSGSQWLTLDEGTPDCRLFPSDLLARAYRDRHRPAHRRRQPVALWRSARIGRAARADRGNAQRAARSRRRRRQYLHHARQPDGCRAGRARSCSGRRYGADGIAQLCPAGIAFRSMGATVVGVPLDREGIDVAAVERMCRLHRVRAIFPTPHHHFPLRVALRPERRLRLLELARQFAFAIIEDDYDHEYHFESPARSCRLPATRRAGSSISARCRS